MISGRGLHSQFFVQGLGPALVAKRSSQTTGLQQGQYWSGLSVGKKKSYLFSARGDCRYSKACLQNVSRKYSKVWLRRANIQSYFTPEGDPILELSKYKATTQKNMFSAQKSKRSRRFLEIDLDCLHTCSMSPCQAVDELGFSCFCFLSPESLDILSPKYPKKTQLKKHIWRRKASKIYSVTGWQGFMEHACQIPGSHFQEMAWTLDAQRIWGDRL